MDPDERARLRDEANREQFAMRRELKDMDDTQHALERQMEDFDKGEEHALRDIENEWRREHAGKDPERAPAWRERHDRGRRSGS